MLRLRTSILILIIAIAVTSGIFWYRVNFSSNGDYTHGLKVSLDEEIKETEEKLNKGESIIIAKEIEEPLKFLFFGDVMLDRNVGDILENKTLTDLLTNLKSKEENIFSDKHIIGANLEGTITNNGEHYSPINKYDFAFSIENVEELKNYNFNYFALANNHFLDQGAKGVTETRENLSEANYYFSGSPDAQIDDNSRYDVAVNDKTIAMISLSMVYSHFDRDKALVLVEEAASETDLVIINIHWGNEYEHYFNIYQQEVGKSLIDAGADIIIGHHPHVVQGMEIYKGRPIFYSLGNFIFDQYFSSDTQEGLALDISYKDNIFTIDFLPFKSFRSAPTFLQEEDKKIFLDKYIEWSEISEDVGEEIIDGGIQIFLDKDTEAKMN